MSEGKATRPAQRSSTTTRVVILVVVVAVAAIATVAAIVRHRSAEPTAAGSGKHISALDPKHPELLFSSTKLDRDLGSLAAVPLSNPSAVPGLSPLKCIRVDYRNGTGLCLTSAKTGLLSHTSAMVFDHSFHVLHTFRVQGNPSRARVSPDGHYGATTSFLTGDSYATTGAFSTRTTIYDLQAGTTLLDLEKLRVTKDGHHIQAADFNFWGVTFVPGSTDFYATLGTADHQYLIEGDFTTKKAHVVRDGVECPSLSPDGTRLAFKERNGGPTVTWHISVLDLATMQEHEVGNPRINVDDQVAWLDNQTIMYGVPHDPKNEGKIAAGNKGFPTLGNGSSIQTDTYTISADGQSAPKLFLAGSWSTVMADGS